MPQISLRVGRVDETGRARVDRRKVVPPLHVADIDDALRSEQHAVAPVARRHHAVEHVDSPLDALQQIGRRAHAHQVAGFVAGQQAVEQPDHLVHHRSRFAHGQSPDRIAVGVELPDELGRAGPQIGISAPLHDREQRLIMTVFRLRLPIAVEAPLEPATGQIERAGRIVVRRVARRTLVERHHDVGPDRTLDIDHSLGREQMLRPVDMRAEAAAFLRKFPATGQREDLKPAAVGQNRTVPRAETMQAAGSLQNIGPRTQVQMIGIAQNDLCARLVRQVAVKHALDAAYGTHGHENGRFDRPVVGRNQSGAGRAAGIGMKQFEVHRRQR